MLQIWQKMPVKPFKKVSIQFRTRNRQIEIKMAYYGH